MNPGKGLFLSIKYFTTGVAPYRRFVIDYNAVQYDGASTNTVTFQIQLHETTNIIEIHSTDVQSEGAATQRTQGIENSGGSAAYFIASRNNTNWTASNDYVSFVPTCLDIETVTVNARPNIALNVSPVSTSVCSGSAVPVTITSAESNVLYQLQNDATSTPLSGFFLGTGANLTITSDPLTANTTIKVYARHATTLCDGNLTNKVAVTVSAAPTTSNGRWRVMSQRPVRIRSGNGSNRWDPIWDLRR